LGTAKGSHQQQDGIVKVDGTEKRKDAAMSSEKRSRRRKGFSDRDVTRIAHAQVTGTAARAGGKDADAVVRLAAGQIVRRCAADVLLEVSR
jgi:hypothetical protein